MGHCPGPRIVARSNFRVVYRAQSGTGLPFSPAMAAAGAGGGGGLGSGNGLEEVIAQRDEHEGVRGGQGFVVEEEVEVGRAAVVEAEGHKKIANEGLHQGLVKVCVGSGRLPA